MKHDPIKIDGHTYTVNTRRDNHAEPPWESEDGHIDLQITCGETLLPDDAVVIASSAEATYWYSHNDAIDRATRESWAAHGQDAETLRQISAGECPDDERVIREIAERAVAADAQRMNAYLSGDWYCIGVEVTAPSGERSARWYIESDSSADYIRRVASDLAHELHGAYVAELARIARTTGPGLRVHRFGDMVALFVRVDGGKTTYLSPDRARWLRDALDGCARDIDEQPSFYDSTFATREIR